MPLIFCLICCMRKNMAGRLSRVCSKGLTVLVTGGTSGFGEATARRFIAEGSRVIVTGRREGRLLALKKELGERLHTIRGDVTDTDAMKEALDSLPTPFAHVDVLVNNAGLGLGLEPAYKASLDDWNTVIDTNIKGLVAMTRMVLPQMVERDRGHIVNIGSVAGTYPYPGGNCYGGTKAFVHQFSLNLRADLLGKNVRVTNLEPGMCTSEFSIVRFKGNEEAAKKVYSGMQPITSDDIAEAIHWVVTLPAHVNINTMELMPVSQASGAFAVARKPH